MMTNFLGVQAAFISISTTITSNGELPSPFLKIPSMSSFPLVQPSKSSRSRRSVIPTLNSSAARSSGATEQENEVEAEAEAIVAEGYTITQFCDKIIDLFLYEKPKSEEWRKYLVLRQDWKKYSDYFYNRCRARADAENNSESKEMFIAFARKVKLIDDEIEEHHALLQEIEDSPMDIDAIVARRRKDFTGDFFRHLMLIQETCSNLEDREAVARLGARCLVAISAYDKTPTAASTFAATWAKCEDIAKSRTVDVAFAKIKLLALAGELDDFLVGTMKAIWEYAKDDPTANDKVKDRMKQLYNAAKSNLKGPEPTELLLLKYVLNITDPEEQLSALATAFSQAREDATAVYVTPLKVHRWIEFFIQFYCLNKRKVEEEYMTAWNLFILKETIEEKYLDEIDKDPKDEE